MKTHKDFSYLKQFALYVDFVPLIDRYPGELFATVYFIYWEITSANKVPTIKAFSEYVTTSIESTQIQKFQRLESAIDLLWNNLEGKLKRRKNIIAIAPAVIIPDRYDKFMHFFKERGKYAALETATNN